MRTDNTNYALSNVDLSRFIALFMVVIIGGVGMFALLHPHVAEAASVNISSFGAVGNGKTDNTAAFTKAFQTSPAGTTITFDAGKTYAYSSSIIVTVNKLHLTGGGTLLATNAENSAIQINSNNVTIDGGMTFKFNTTGVARHYAGWQAMIYGYKTTGTVLRNITVNGSPSIGILMLGSSNYVIDNATVENTLADSIHSTGGSHDGLVENTTSINSGDDGFANVSYVNDGAQVYNMTYMNDTVKNQAFARGFSVVGGHDITFNNITASSTSGAAIYIASESEFNTYGVANVHIHGATIIDANASTTVNQGAIVVYDSQPSYGIADVDISDVSISGTHAGVTSIVNLEAGKGLGALRIGLYRFTLTNNNATPLVQTSGLPLSYTTQGWINSGVGMADHIGFIPVNGTPVPSVTPKIPTTPVPTTVRGDLNGDRKVNTLDLSIMLSHWNMANSLADLDHNGTVNIIDLSILLKAWTS